MASGVVPQREPGVRRNGLTCGSSSSLANVDFFVCSLAHLCGAASSPTLPYAQQSRVAAESLVRVHIRLPLLLTSDTRVAQDPLSFQSMLIHGCLGCYLPLVSFHVLRAWDVAQVAASHLDHPADAAVEYHLAPSEGEASNLFSGDPWRDRKGIGISDDLDQFGAGTR